MVHIAARPMKVTSSHFFARICRGAVLSRWKLQLPCALKALRTFRTLREEALKMAVNRFTARFGEDNVTQQHAALKEPAPAYVKTVLISNTRCRRQKRQVANQGRTQGEGLGGGGRALPLGPKKH